MIRSVVVALCLAACSSPPPPPPEVLVPRAPAPSTAPPPSAESSARIERPVDAGPFRFQQGTPRDALTAYATHYWGPGGATVFTSAASLRTADVAAGPALENLIEVGQYAVIEIPELGGFFVRDFGERGWVSGLEAMDLTGGPKPEVVLRYTLRDDADVERVDWARWSKSPRNPPEINAVAHMVIEVWSFAAPKPRLLFAHEQEGWALCCGSEIGPAPPRVSDDVKLKRGEITMTFRDAWRATAASWREVPLRDIPPALTGWDTMKTRTFRFDGTSFTDR